MIILNIYKVQPEVYLIHMSLKINYLDKLNNSMKNIGIFVSKDTKITDFKGIFNENISKKIIGYLTANKKTEKNKIYCLNEDYDKKIFIIFVSKIETSNDVKSLGANFYDTPASKVAGFLFVAVGQLPCRLLFFSHLMHHL